MQIREFGLFLHGLTAVDVEGFAGLGGLVVHIERIPHLGGLLHGPAQRYELPSGLVRAALINARG